MYCVTLRVCENRGVAPLVLGKHIVGLWGMRRILYCIYFTTPLQDGQTALYMASGYGHSDVVQQLITTGATVDLPNHVILTVFVEHLANIILILARDKQTSSIGL